MPPTSLETLALSGAIDQGWALALEPVSAEIDQMDRFLRAETAAGRPWLPPVDTIFRAFRDPFDAVSVLILGQDPYPTPGHPIGLAFAVERHVRPLPRSLQNIAAELRGDIEVTAGNGDLSKWADQGVLLLNRVLTGQPGTPASHRGKGWVAEVDGRIIGFAIADLQGRSIWALFIHPDFDRQGIGRALHDIMLNWYFGQTTGPVKLSTAPGTRAAGFYRCAGWRETGHAASGEVQFEMAAWNNPS